MTSEPTPQPDATPEAAANLPVLTVSELAGALKRAVEETFAWVRVRGEITGFRRPGSGHLYFKLKDENAVIEAVCWRGVAGRLGLQPEDGLEVIASGRLSTYAPRSQYQIVVESLELAGEGALLKLLEERKRKLTAEGLFAAERKKEIPYLPERIGVVTSPSGAVIRDILHRIAERFPRHVLVWPVQVQGEGAAEQIAAAIDGFNALEAEGVVPRPDVLIVARGGGSLEDLWAFNEEIVVRAAAASRIPLISAVGHETDTTLIDLAADHRAPTPSAAAEMAVPVRAELVETVTEAGLRLAGALARLLEELRTELVGLGRGLPDPQAVIGNATQRLDDWTERLHNAASVDLRRRNDLIAKTALRLRHPREVLTETQGRLKAAVAGLSPRALRAEIGRHGDTMDAFARRLGEAVTARLADGGTRLEGQAKLLDSFSYERVLERGFVLVRDEADAPVTSVKATRPGMGLGLRFHDGEASAVVSGRVARAPKGRAGKKRSVGKPDEPDQGELL